MADGVCHPRCRCKVERATDRIANDKPAEVYTCQQPQPKRCKFFLWDEEAKSREAAAVLSNSRSEPITAPQTPTKPSSVPSPYGLQTPYTDTSKGYGIPTMSTPYTPSKPSTVTRPNGNTQDTITTAGTSDDEFYDWPASDDEDALQIVDNVSTARIMPPPETPRKAPKTDLLSTPGKRRFSETQNGIEITWPTLEVVEDDVFVTPSTKPKKEGLSTSEPAMLSPADTPTLGRFKDVLNAGLDSELTLEVLEALQDNQISLSSNAKAELKRICDRHSLSARGIIRGRDISRAMVNTKNEKISELQNTIAALQAERDTNRVVIRHLRRDTELKESSRDVKDD
ncbi:MAG: hypothetical protein Q9213_003367 [Squamulea squamosa]